ncbi:MAG: chemotaxis protein [Nitrospira bacterium SG8_35_4]|nr:MAG: chemotaxis protein [Nitrospira bacterium SG8_35_4]
MLSIPLMDTTFKDLRDYIYEHSGIYIADTKKYLIENRLARILQDKKLSSFEEYLKIVKFCSNGNELSRLFDAVTTNETYFFREIDQLNVFNDDLVPNLLKQNKGMQSLKIWSAACSSGEEPYSIAMMLLEKKLSNMHYEIHASDICESVLASAKKGVYSSYSIRNVPQPYLDKYFSKNDQLYNLSPAVSKSVNFKKINLIDEKNVKSVRGMDIIFCRNVLIYFDSKAKQKVVSHLYNALNPGGYLIIGSSESLHSVTRAFRPSVIKKVIIYQKV